MATTARNDGAAAKGGFESAAAAAASASSAMNNNNSNNHRLLPPNDTFDTADSREDEYEYEEHEHAHGNGNPSGTLSSGLPHPPLHHHQQQQQQQQEPPRGRGRFEKGGHPFEPDDGEEVDDDDCYKHAYDDSEQPTRSPNRQSTPTLSLSGSTTIPSNDLSDDDAGATKRPLKRALLGRCCFCRLSDDAYELGLQALYIAVFGVFGSILRIYLGRFFGLDCQNAVSDDWFTRISDAICVTTNGKTDQTGGALFTDLPSNMVGSFVMGLLSPSILNRSAIHPIAWFRQDHPLQRHPAFALALKVGFCGCLTTFASWNTQMVVMLDGTDTELGSQVAPALFGYLMGMCTSIASFVCGRHAYDGWVRIHDPSVLPQPDSANAGVVAHDGGDVEIMERGGGHGGRVPSKDGVTHERKASLLVSRLGRLWGAVAGIQVMPFLLLAGMTSAFVVGDVVYNDMFYRKLWMCVVLAPCGALLRWHLSQYNNGTPPPFVAAAIARRNLEWVPWGTLTSNMIAVVVSVLAEALEDRYAVQGAPGYDWISTALPAVETGFAGSLSTVSSFVRELVDLQQSNPARMYLYGFGSLTFAMLLGLLVYSPVIRFL
jgi:fluoride exporter